MLHGDPPLAPGASSAIRTTAFSAEQTGSVSFAESRVFFEKVVENVRSRAG
jgi:hypothetical protein